MAFATITSQLDARQRQEFLAELSGGGDWESEADRLYAGLEARGYGK